MHSMETENITARAEELKLQADEAFKGVHFRLPRFEFVPLNYARIPLGWLKFFFNKGIYARNPFFLIYVILQ